MSRGEQPAYPVPKDTWAEGYPPGLTIREEFAKAALQGVIAALGGSDETIRILLENAAKKGVSIKQQVARVAVDYADELLAALERKS